MARKKREPRPMPTRLACGCSWLDGELVPVCTVHLCERGRASSVIVGRVVHCVPQNDVEVNAAFMRVAAARARRNRRAA